MKAVVKGRVRDLAAFVAHLRSRNARFRRATAAQVPPGPVDALAAALHPRIQHLRVLSRTEETPTTVTYRLAPVSEEAMVAPFRAGQYVTVEAEVGDTRVSRPFSIACTPQESRAGNYYDITVRAGADGFVAPWMATHWQPGTQVVASDPQGFFVFEPLRDARELVCLAGGSGIAPFRAQIPDLLARYEDIAITLLYGIASPEEVIYDKFWRRLAADRPERFAFVPVCSGGAEGWNGKRGLLTAKLIREAVDRPEMCSYFVCGPGAMHTHMDLELAEFALRPRQLRRENFGTPERDRAASGAVRITVAVEGAAEPVTIEADRGETVLVALERSGLNPPAYCRSGECGWCRAQLVAGEVHAPAHHDNRRAADRKFGYIHPCSSFPETHLSIRVPVNPKKIAGG